MVHAERLETTVGHRPPSGVHRDHRQPEEQRLAERQARPRIGGVHEGERTGLELGDSSVGLPGTGAAARDHLAADRLVGLGQDGHRLDHPLVFGGDRLHHQVALVAHHAADPKAPGPGQVAQTAGVVDGASAAKAAHVNVDEHLGDACGRGCVDGGVGVHGDGDPGVAGGHGAQAVPVEDFVGQQQVVAEPGGGQADDLSRRGGTEGAVAGSRQLAGHGGGLERLHVRAQRRARPRGAHGGHVVLEGVGVDDQGRGGKVRYPHADHKSVRTDVGAWPVLSTGRG
ncbi:hypothetical protein BH23ACT2_BH23ACT2_26390 [soil metagenome]